MLLEGFVHPAGDATDDIEGEVADNDIAIGQS
jgi:hypothetical protein